MLRSDILWSSCFESYVACVASVSSRVRRESWETLATQAKSYGPKILLVIDCIRDCNTSFFWADPVWFIHVLEF